MHESMFKHAHARTARNELFIVIDNVSSLAMKYFFAVSPKLILLFLHCLPQTNDRDRSKQLVILQLRKNCHSNDNNNQKTAEGTAFSAVTVVFVACIARASLCCCI